MDNMTSIPSAAANWFHSGLSAITNVFNQAQPQESISTWTESSGLANTIFNKMQATQESISNLAEHGVTFIGSGINATHEFVMNNIPNFETVKDLANNSTQVVTESLQGVAETAHTFAMDYIPGFEIVKNCSSQAWATVPSSEEVINGATEKWQNFNITALTENASETASQTAQYLIDNPIVALTGAAVITSLATGAYVFLKKPAVETESRVEGQATSPTSPQNPKTPSSSQTDSSYSTKSSCPLEDKT